MRTARPPLDAKGQELLKRVESLLDEMLASDTGTLLGVTRPRLITAVDELAKHRYRQIGTMEPLAAKR